MMECASCVSLADHMMLLVVACRQSVVMMEGIITRFNQWKIERDQQGIEKGDHHYSRRSSVFSKHDAETSILPGVWFGRYEADIEERKMMVNVLVVSHLRSTLSLIQRHKILAESTQRTTQLSMLTDVDSKLRHLAKNMHGC